MNLNALCCTLTNFCSALKTNLWQGKACFLAWNPIVSSARRLIGSGWLRISWWCVLRVFRRMCFIRHRHSQGRVRTGSFRFPILLGFPAIWLPYPMTQPLPTLGISVCAVLAIASFPQLLFFCYFQFSSLRNRSVSVEQAVEVTPDMDIEEFDEFDCMVEPREWRVIEWLGSW